MDFSYDDQTRAAAGAIWMTVGETPEGKDRRWWDCMLRPGEVSGGREGQLGAEC